MSDRVPELRELPSGLVLDGELVAFKEQGAPHWPLLCAYTRAELDALEGELGPEQGPIVAFAAATGLRPQEWLPLERRDIDRARRVLRVERVVSDGEVRHVGKTARSLREVPLSRRALDALDRLPPRLDKTLLFPTPNGGLLNLTTSRRHAWTPAVDAAGIAKPARIYDLRSTWRRLRSDATSPAAAARAANSSSAVLIVILAWADRSLRCSWSFQIPTASIAMSASQPGRRSPVAAMPARSCSTPASARHVCSPWWPTMTRSLCSPSSPARSSSR
jgi:Phage integrase family